MIFYTRKKANAQDVKGGDPQRPYEFNFGRVVLAFCLVAILIVGAFVAHYFGWSDGANSLLQMATAGVAGIFGVILGESNASRDFDH